MARAGALAQKSAVNSECPFVPPAMAWQRPVQHAFAVFDVTTTWLSFEQQLCRGTWFCILSQQHCKSHAPIATRSSMSLSEPLIHNLQISMPRLQLHIAMFVDVYDVTTSTLEGCISSTHTCTRSCHFQELGQLFS